MSDINETKGTKDMAAADKIGKDVKEGKEGRHELLADAVTAAIKAQKICNMTQLAIHLKVIKKGQSVSGSFSKKLKVLVPELQDLFDENNGIAKDTATTSSKPSTSTAAKVKAPVVPKAVKVVKDVKPIKPVAKVEKVVKSVKAVKASKTVKSDKATNTDKSDNSNPDGNPYRSYSSYGKLWSLLFKNKDKGISRADLIKQGMTAIGKPEKNTGFDVAVVVSPSQDGSAHRSANKAADKYWVERDGGLLKLHMR